MISPIENNPMSRREFLKLVSRATLGLASLGLLEALQACGSKSPETPIPKFSPEIVGLPVVLEMPFGSKFIVETIPPHPRLNVNKTLTEKLLYETVKKPTAPIKVSLYPDDWLRIQPDDTLLGINEQDYKSLPKEEKDTFKDGLTTTVYDSNNGIPKAVAVHIASGRFFKAAREDKSMTVRNEFLPEGIIVNPIISLNAVFYHEVFGHALLRNLDYRKKTPTELTKEEHAALKGETEWVKALARMGEVVSNDSLFLVPY